MRSVQSSKVRVCLSKLLDDVERGETIIITRHGRPIARLTPEVDQRQAGIKRTMAQIEAFRATMPRLTLDDILSGRHG